MKFADFCCNDVDAKSPIRLFSQLNSQLRKDSSVFSTSYDHYRYAPIECFNTLSDVYRAMEIAKEDLEEKCDMIIDDEGNVVECAEEENDPNQLSLFEVVLLPTWFQTAVAA